MFRIVDFNALTRFVVVFTVIVSVAIYAVIEVFWLPGFSLMKLISIASVVSTFIIFTINAKSFSRRIWSMLRYFDGSLFPDINGTWEGEIVFGDSPGLKARAVIRQTLLKTQIDMHTETSKSITLESTPITEGGQSKLYYVHRVTPKNPNWHVYTGSTIFDVRAILVNDKPIVELSGYYYTDRKTNGRVRLQQLNSDPSRDVSFY